jgi:hypothetical protein
MTRSVCVTKLQRAGLWLHATLIDRGFVARENAPDTVKIHQPRQAFAALSRPAAAGPFPLPPQKEKAAGAAFFVLFSIPFRADRRP